MPHWFWQMFDYEIVSIVIPSLKWLKLLDAAQKMIDKVEQERNTREGEKYKPKSKTFMITVKCGLYAILVFTIAFIILKIKKLIK